MRYSWQFNGTDMNSLLITTEVTRDIGPNRTGVFQQVGASNGRRFVRSTADVATIHVACVIIDDMPEKRREIARVLTTSKPVKLTFDDEPGLYYMAITDGQISMPETFDHGEFEITFKVPDGVAHAVDERSFPVGADGTVLVSNDGTAETPLDIDVTFTSDANAIGFTSEDNILQFGTPEANSDDSDFVASKMLISDYMEPASKALWSVNAGKIRWRADDGDHTSKIDGTLSWQPKLVSVSSFGSFDHKTASGYWHGPTLTRVLTGSAENFEAVFWITFKPSSGRATCQGLLEANVCDADGNFIVGMELKDNVTTADAVTYSFFVGDERVNTTSLPKKVLKDNGGFYGTATMKKVGNTFTFRLARIGKNDREMWGSTPISRTNNTVAMLSAGQVTMYGAQWRDFAKMQIEFAHVKVTKINTEDESLIPMTFHEGDTLFVEGATNRTYINGVRDDAYRVLGSSQMFKAAPGDTTIYVQSDGTFDATLTERERWL